MIDRIRNFFFQNRSYTPIPLVLVLLYQARPASPWIYLGAALILIGESIRFWSILHAGGATRTRNVGADSLVTSGPYGYVRNPLYVGNMFIYAGVVFFAGGPWMWELLLIALLFFFIQYSLIISLEEETLNQMFGNAYQEYKKEVRRILPRYPPWRKSESASAKLSFREAMKPEKSTLLNIGVMLFLIGCKWLWMAV